MTLSDSLLTAKTLTDQVGAALSEGRLESCGELLAVRATAMERFEAAHRAASAVERERCRGLLVELTEADRALQQEAAAALASVGRALQTNLGVSPRFGGAYDSHPVQACVNRKA